MQQDELIDAGAAPVADAWASDPEGVIRDSILLGDFGAEYIDLMFRLERSMAARITGPEFGHLTGSLVNAAGGAKTAPGMGLPQ